MTTSLLDIYLIEEMVGSLVLMAIFLFVLIKSSGSKLIRTISALLLICNFATLVVYGTREKLDKCAESVVNCQLAQIYIWVHAVVFSVQDLTFALSYWMLTSEYFEISLIMPFVVKDLPIPVSLLQCKKLLNRVFSGLIVLLPIAELPLLGVIWIVSINQNTSDPNSHVALKLRIPLNIIQSFFGLLQIATGIILMKALASIRNFIKKTGQEDVLNSRILLINLAIFGLYLLSLVLADVISYVGFFSI
jgi:hypothetical protein